MLCFISVVCRTVISCLLLALHVGWWRLQREFRGESRGEGRKGGKKRNALCKSVGKQERAALGGGGRVEREGLERRNWRV